ncbi:TRAP transporter large permease [Chromohalobacter japonicus]|uniref:TRAP transporter large permease n=1 Tax=Chromohalobacter japonicus TaxID=223900 RepID=UPI001FF19A6F|nr:TRAP transporter large permease subunit [Chromohalobacter japonicus]MCK0754271.1 TRAP transporter large permease subunit [Chromohalobacter japonicus]
MSELSGFWMFPVLLLFILGGFPIALSMICTAFIFGYMAFGGAASFQLLSQIESVAGNTVLAAVPLFVFMGAFLEKSGIASRLLAAIHLWTKRVPGGLALSTVIMGAIFAAISGVVGATEAVIGLLTVPVMLKHAYDKRLISGTVCASGSLGTVIPPSITVIVLGPVANVSVGDLFAGLLFPGLIMALLFGIYILVIASINPSLAPRDLDEGPRYSFTYKLKVTAAAFIPPAILIFAVLGTIMMGIATPTEAAALGALGSVLLSICYRSFTLDLLRSALMNTLLITTMILLIVLGGSMFAGVFFASGGMQAIQGILTNLGVPGWGVIGLILLLAFLAGFVLDLISVVLILIPISIPLVTALNFDPIWFCIVFLIVLQTSYLTPPMAPSIFYLRAVAPAEITLMHMYKGVLPFIALQFITLALVIAFPEIATWLPSKLLD